MPTTTHHITTRHRTPDAPANQAAWAEVRRNLRLADIASIASKNAITRAGYERHMADCLHYSRRAMLQAGTLLGQPIGSVSEVRRLLEERGL